jgi:hypothetical protein
MKNRERDTNNWIFPIFTKHFNERRNQVKIRKNHNYAVSLSPQLRHGKLRLLFSVVKLAY